MAPTRSTFSSVATSCPVDRHRVRLHPGCLLRSLGAEGVPLLDADRFRPTLVP